MTTTLLSSGDTIFHKLLIMECAALADRERVVRGTWCLVSTPARGLGRVCAAGGAAEGRSEDYVSLSKK